MKKAIILIIAALALAACNQPAGTSVDTPIGDEQSLTKIGNPNPEIPVPTTVQSVSAKAAAISYMKGKFLTGSAESRKSLSRDEMFRAKIDTDGMTMKFASFSGEDRGTIGFEVADDGTVNTTSSGDITISGKFDADAKERPLDLKITVRESAASQLVEAKATDDSYVDSFSEMPDQCKFTKTQHIDYTEEVPGDEVQEVAGSVQTNNIGDEVCSLMVSDFCESDTEEAGMKGRVKVKVMTAYVGENIDLGFMGERILCRDKCVNGKCIGPMEKSLGIVSTNFCTTSADACKDMGKPATQNRNLIMDSQRRLADKMGRIIQQSMAIDWSKLPAKEPVKAIETVPAL